MFMSSILALLIKFTNYHEELTCEGIKELTFNYIFVENSTKDYFLLIL